MVKKILQDVIPAGKRSIRHIPIPGNRKIEAVERKEEDEASLPRRRARQKGSFFRILVSVLLLLFFAGVVLAATWLFASATVTVTPKQMTTSVDTVLQSGKSVLGNLPSTVVTSTSTAFEVITTNKEETVNRKASGQIVIFNNFSSESQRLIKNTRFEAANGHIYKIDSSVVVPGQKVEGGKKVPGSVAVTVYADVAGPEYNLTMTELKGDFTIPGFKGSPRYESFFARQKTDILGGFSGIARVVDDVVRDTTEKRLQASISETLWNNLVASLPQGYTTFQSLYTTSFSTVSEDNPSGQGVKITVTAVGTTVAFDTAALSQAVAKRSLSDFKGEPILIENLSAVEVSPRVTNGNDPFEENPLVFSAKGNVHLVWQFDKEEFKAKLAGKSKRETDSIMRSYPAIETAEVVVKPSWLSKFPSNPKKIVIQIKLD
ncbi:MAG TPA: hypothetical protein VJH94_03120 [Candidatus Paceibacterota bacterium]